MKFVTLLFCEHATLARDGLFSVLNGGVTRIGRPVFPSTLGLTLVATVSLEGDYVKDKETEIDFKLTAADDGTVIGGATGAFVTQLVEGADPRSATSPVVLDLSTMPVPKPGTYTLTGTLPEYDVTAEIHIEVLGTT